MSPSAVSQPAVSEPARSRFQVSLHCPTPLTHPTLELTATSADDAWAQFCAANGISNSEHPREIRPL
ncbi:MAG: hypothetical protein JSS02_27190 [Planctomycetes bacterium]|nr:hypothetical protein [Planctomycetota bacterium]